MRDRRDIGEISPHGLAVARGRLAEELVSVVEQSSTVPDVERFANHLAREFTAIFTFLFHPEVDAQPTGERSRRFAEASSLARSAVEATEQSEGRKHSRSLLPYCERQHKEDSTPPIFSSRCYERLNPSFRRDLGRPLNEKPGKQIPFVTAKRNTFLGRLQVRLFGMRCSWLRTANLKSTDLHLPRAARKLSSPRSRRCPKMTNPY